MTVEELIEKLKTKDPKAIVCVWTRTEYITSATEIEDGFFSFRDDDYAADQDDLRFGPEWEDYKPAVAIL